MLKGFLAYLGKGFLVVLGKEFLVVLEKRFLVVLGRGLVSFGGHVHSPGADGFYTCLI